MANPMLDTASQRPATGMDKAARKLILKALEGCSRLAVFNGFMRDRYPDSEDYIAAVSDCLGRWPGGQNRCRPLKSSPANSQS